MILERAYSIPEAAPAPRRTSRMLALSLATSLALVLTPACIATAAAAAPPSAPHHDKVRVCDPTACFVAWDVVDSDDDGASDADELMAGTDPYDASSRPLMRQLAELGEAYKLPSFEAGLGVFVLFPAELLDLREQAGLPTTGAFPLPERPEALERMGISLKQLELLGLSAERDGLTIGLDTVGSADNLPGRRVGGMDASLISAGTQPPVHFVGHGGVAASYPTFFGNGWVTEYRDGTKDVAYNEGGGTFVIERTNPDGSEGPTRTIKQEDTTDGDVDVHRQSETVTDRDNDVVSVTNTESHTFADGAVSTMTVTTEYVRDADGNVTSTVVTTTVSYISADGEYGSGAKTVESCDANGANCSELSSEYEDSDTVNDEEYVNPDADNPSIVTQEAIDGVLRTRGAAVAVVRDWTVPGLEGQPEDPGNPSAVMLVDSSLAEHYLLIEPMRITKAQPEARPDLPSPIEPAPPTSGGGCDGLC